MPGRACLHALEEHLVDGGGLVRELIGRLDHHIVWCFDQIIGFQNTISRWFRDKIPLLIGMFDGQLACGQPLMFQRKLDQIIPPILRNTVPDRLYLPYWRVSSIISATKRSSSARPRGNCRCVDQCWPRTRQIRRSDTLIWLRIRSMQVRRREGLRSFPVQLPIRSACPASDQKLLAVGARSLSVVALVL